jgi:internalin A
MARTRTSKPLKMTGQDKTFFRKVKRLLGADDFDLVRQGAELLLSLPPAVISALAEGVSLEEGTDLWGRPITCEDGPVFAVTISDSARRKGHLRGRHPLYVALAILRASGALASVQTLTLHHYIGVMSLDVLSVCTQLTWLDLSKADITDVDVLTNLTALRTLDLTECDQLENVDGLAGCEALSVLKLSKCSSLTNIDGVAHCKALESVELHHCKALSSLAPLADLPVLSLWSDEHLHLEDCNALVDLDGLQRCTGLVSVNLKMSSRPAAALQNVDGLVGCAELTRVDLSHTHVADIGGLAGKKKLTTLDLWGATLTNVDALADCSALTTLDLRSSTVEHVDGLGSCEALESVDLGYCRDLKNIRGLASLTGLTKLGLNDVSAQAIVGSLRPL